MNTWVELVGYLGTGVFLVSYAQNGMIRLRVISLISSAIFIVYGSLIASRPILIEEVIFVPVNIYGLYKMLRLIRQSKEAVEGAQTIEWIRPFSSRIYCESGQMLFRLGDPAADMYVVASGKFRLIESHRELQEGAVVGELGFVSPGNTRTQSMQCEEAGALLRISYNSLRELYFQNPKFGIYTNGPRF
jgi:hypothetical protein